MKEYLREDLRDFAPYQASDEPHTIKMDANESPYDLPLKVREVLAKELISGNGLNLYPDSDANTLRRCTAAYIGASMENILIGAGSDELIQVIVNAFVNKGETVFYPSPSFGMYRIFAQIAGGIPKAFKLDSSFHVSIETLLADAKKLAPKIIFLCSPNNPTGNAMPVSDILTVLENFDGIVVVDEAYGEFAETTICDQINRYPNLIVLRTFSKALGIAGLRVGYSVCCKDLADQLYKVKPPYNVNSFSQRAAILILEEWDTIKERVAQVIKDRDSLYHALKSLPELTVYPSQANFLLMRVKDGRQVYEGLLTDGILVRHYLGHPELGDFLRVTVGLPIENQAFLKALQRIIMNMEVS